MSGRRPTSESELVEFLRSIDVSAPESLHRHVDGLIAARSRSARARARLGRTGARVAVAGALAVAVAVALALLLGSSGPPALNLREAAALNLRPATQAAPRESRRSRAELAAAVDGVAFPYWEERLGWRSTGERTDRIAGRSVRTVFYADANGRRVAYSIVAGRPAPHAQGGAAASHDGVRYTLLTDGATAVVSWLRAGHLCVVSGRGVGMDTVLRLASWEQRRLQAA